MKKILLTLMPISALMFVSVGFSQVTPIEAINQRTKPIGEVRVVEVAKPEVPKQTPTTTTADVGKNIFNTYCSACHTTGVAGAPKVGDAGEWNLRQKQGLKILVQRVIDGYKLMPAKGGCAACSKEEITQAVNYILNSK